MNISESIKLGSKMLQGTPLNLLKYMSEHYATKLKLLLNGSAQYLKTLTIKDKNFGQKIAVACLLPKRLKSKPFLKG